ncbi:MAG: IS256 family transposase [Blastochloris sp.]|nr:IS256 family transposase [Blastochloris sp.]
MKAWTQQGLEQLATQAGLMILDGLLSEEITQKLGEPGQQQAYRHGHQNGYVIFDGRKVAVQRPRVRARQGAELALESYERFQQDGDRQRAVARQLMRHCSTRNYQGAISECVEGYGIKKSSVSRQWKLATERQLQEMLERPVPKDLVALLIDAKYFSQHCVVTALGVTQAGTKHILGLWQGSTENSTVVKALLGDLVERGLDTEQPLLVVLDGGKGLRKAVDEVFGSKALVQRCRIHKQRNVLEQLPKSLRGKYAGRLRMAWGLEDWCMAQKELEKIAQELEAISPGACRSLREGLEETLSLQKLGVNDALLKSLSSTNLIESAYSQVEAYCGRVKHWRNGNMVLRWSASALIWSEKRFRKIRGHEHLPQLKVALQNHLLETMKKTA